MSLATVVVTASHAQQDIRNVPVAVDVFTSDRLQSSPALTIDETLRDDPAFSLFRRSSSLIANPTAQGVSLRGIGPSGASRSLVLLDGVPLNDPFGGWVAWNQLPLLSLERAEIVRGGGSGSWGNAALGGVVQLFTLRPAGTQNPPAGQILLQGGEYGTRSAEIFLREGAGPGTISLDARSFATDGFGVVRPAQRGPVDLPLDSQHQALQATWAGALTPTLNLVVDGRWVEEDRGNGTPLQRNHSRAAVGSITLSGTPQPELNYSATAYVQDASFRSFFSSVNTARTAETPANDQYAVPATATGVAGSVTWQRETGATTLGADFREVEGETREDYLFAADTFTRRRIAGGEQNFLGVFLNHDRALAESLHVTAQLRADAWENRDGHRVETDRATGAPARDDAYPAQSGHELSPELGLAWSPRAHWRMRGAVYRAFRLPTLNEYYRPFRVGIVNTEANPALQREMLRGGEAGLEFSGGAFHFGATAFDSDLDHAVGNVTLGRTATLISRQRQNLDRVRARGIELNGEWRVSDQLRFRLSWLGTDATVERATLQPNLEGLRLAQVPRQAFTGGIDWTPARDWRVTARVRHISDQFEDDENLLPLAAATITDFRLSRVLTSRWEIFLAVENAFDAKVETGRSAENLTTLGSPRLARIGLHGTWK
ncbi:MAG: cirA 5 [Verrucomicrobia bacterium]|nr:cirA 5 [Verrucomicrobiota bacterium]